MMGHGSGARQGIDRVWELAAEGYRIVDVDSDEVFVGVRMERGGRSLTLLLTREDFVRAFPNLQAAGSDGDDPGERAPREGLVTEG